MTEYKESSHKQWKYKLLETIGKGSYATVKLGQTASGEKVAIKIYQKKDLIDKQRQDNLKREVEMLNKM